MAGLNIVEMPKSGAVHLGRKIPARALGGASQDVAIGASSTQSTAVGAAAGIVRLCPDADCRVAIGANPTATSSSPRLPADETEYVTIGGGHKVAVIAV